MDTPRAAEPVRTGFAASELLQRLAASPWALAVVLVLGVAARVRQYLAQTSYWYDESYVLLNVFAKTHGELVGPLDLHQVTPPLFLWGLRSLYLILGPAEWAMRLPAFVAGLAALLLMVPLARRVVGSPGWIWAVGLLAISHRALSHSFQVKPYSSDLLFTEVVLLAAFAYVDPASSARGRARALLGLLVGAAVLPWLSFPSVFVLGGASLALFVHAARQRRTGVWAAWATFSGLQVASFFGLWLAAARFHNDDYQRTAFAAYFLDLSSPLAAVTWVANTLAHLGHYGVSGMGLPVAILGVCGLALLWKRDRTALVLLTGPLVLATAASALKHYPFGERLCLFALPCLWLLAAVAIGQVAGRLRGRLAWPGLAVLLLLLVPGLMRTARDGVWTRRYMEFREGYGFIREQCRADDAVWVAHPEVYHVYFSHDRPVLGYATPAKVVEETARTRRVWLAIPDEAMTREVFPHLLPALEAAGAVPTRRRRFYAVDVVLYEPPGASVRAQGREPPAGRL
jgi:hypothetical protein